MRKRNEEMKAITAKDLRLQAVGVAFEQERPVYSRAGSTLSYRDEHGSS